MVNKLKDSVVIFSNINWESAWQRPQEIATLFSNDFPVFFVEPPISILKFRKVPAALAKFLCSVRRKNKVNIITPLPILPFSYTFKKILKFNRKISVNYLKNILKKAGCKTFLVYIIDPLVVDAVDILHPAVVFYDVIDEVEISSAKGKDIYEFFSKRATFRADEVITTSKSLFSKHKALMQDEKKLHLIPNGANVERFKVCLKKETPLAAELEPFKSRKVIGFIGTLDKRIDVELMEKMCKYFKNETIVMIGEQKNQELLKLSEKYFNLLLIKKKFHRILPLYLKGFGVGIVPYKVNKFTRAIDPVKVYEYFAAGLPVVVTDLPALKSINGALKKVASHTEFLKAVESFLKAFRNSQIDRDKLLDIALSHSWSKRYAHIKSILQKYLESN